MTHVRLKKVGTRKWYWVDVSSQSRFSPLKLSGRDAPDFGMDIVGARIRFETVAYSHLIQGNTYVTDIRYDCVVGEYVEWRMEGSEGTVIQRALKDYRFWKRWWIKLQWRLRSRYL